MPRNLIKSDTTIRSIKPGDERKRLSDGDGLYLLLFVKGGAHGWRFDYTTQDGRRKTISLGTYPDIGLAAARADADEKRAQVAAGVDPSETRKSARATKLEESRVANIVAAGGDLPGTFKAEAKAWLERQAPRWSARTIGMIKTQFENDAYPHIGNKMMPDITALDVLDAVRLVEDRGAGEQARRLLQRIKSVFRYSAIVSKMIATNVTRDLLPEEQLKPRVVNHRKALPEASLTEFWKQLDAYDGDPGTVNALKMLLYTVPRPGELRLTPWSEWPVGVENWRVPAERMKMSKEHINPLSRQARAVIEDQRKISAGDMLAFPSPFYPGKPISDMTLNGALARMGFKGMATAHGFRALFSTVANEHGWPGDVIERQLAHVPKDKVRAAYNRAQYLQQRQEMMQWWADYVDSKRVPVVANIQAASKHLPSPLPAPSEGQATSF